MKQELKDNLLKAIEAAVNPGGCVYMDDGEPCCVIAQLAYMEGVPKSNLSNWDAAPGLAGSDIGSLLNASRVSYPKAHALADKYGADRLIHLQGMWDMSEDPATKIRMREFVEKE